MQHRSTYWCHIHISKNCLKTIPNIIFKVQCIWGKHCCQCLPAHELRMEPKVHGRRHWQVLTGAFTCITTEALLTLQITLHPHPRALTHKIPTPVWSGKLHWVRHPQITLPSCTMVIMCSQKWSMMCFLQGLGQCNAFVHMVIVGN
jgi:hypothetical protein